MRKSLEKALEWAINSTFNIEGALDSEEKFISTILRLAQTRAGKFFTDNEKTEAIRKIKSQIGKDWF